MDEFILAIVVGVRFARKLGVLSKSFMRKRFGFWFLVFGFLLRGQARFGFFLGGVAARFVLVFWALCWHPRFVSSLQASPFGVLVFSLASAIR
ncbi:hypothetical protein VOI32_15980 [Paraburkholderia caribensis]|uniref:Uncharacterized protein n=1 Tax=Paraburkholderia caribensis TaxID=75105 RepID=A0ABV0DWC6_9BURK|nr:hypothetical protein [Paraburkholderia caribensis]MCO4878169.1 hypothetical protein [Paraburkholderia caribensis]PTB28260.1 hypothetical protein C9I56_13520 [Paraburkholderia caribensis]